MPGCIRGRCRPDRGNTLSQVGIGSELGATRQESSSPIRTRVEVFEHAIRRAGGSLFRRSRFVWNDKDWSAARGLLATLGFLEVTFGLSADTEHDAINERNVVFMRKNKKVTRVPESIPAPDQGWLDVEQAASVEVSSEDENYPIESALLGDQKRGWRASEPGSQTIRLIFDSPQRLRRIWLAFEDSEVSRTQEFVLRWSSHVGEPFREIVRQQWNFSSPGGIREIEDYAVDLVEVGMLELTIVPDKSGGEARASLAKMRLS